MQRLRWRMVLGGVALWALVGCGAGTGVAPELAEGGVDDRAAADWVTLQMLPFADQWAASKPRWRDIADALFSSAFQTTYDSAASPSLTLRYDPTPSGPYLVGEVEGTNLKPNFCYQLKLLGRPGTTTNGLWRDGSADMRSNLTLLKAGRWWNYKTEDPAFTTTNDTSVSKSSDYKAGWVPGYVYFGCFVTDEHGTTGGPVAIQSNRSYHVTWKTGQSGTRSEVKGTYLVSQTSSYAYDFDSAEPQPVELWFEKEPDDPMVLALPRGTYNTVLMVTEESFHSNDLGGYWRTVLVSDWPTLSSPKTGLPWVSQRGANIRFTVK